MLNKGVESEVLATICMYQYVWKMPENGEKCRWLFQKRQDDILNQKIFD